MRPSVPFTLERADRGKIFDDDIEKIGPNAVLQLIEALRARGFGDQLTTLFVSADVSVWLSHPPGQMVDARAVGRLHQAVRAFLPTEAAMAVMTEAGHRTADYLLANRIPRAAQSILKVAPARIAAIALSRAVTANASTFAGSGRFEAKSGAETILTLRGNPLCAGERSDRRVCAWNAAVFERLFRTLVSPFATIEETHCEAHGDPECRFVARWKPQITLSQSLEAHTHWGWGRSPSGRPRSWPPPCGRSPPGRPPAGGPP